MVANKGIICTKIGCRFDEKHQMRQPLFHSHPKTNAPHLLQSTLRTTHAFGSVEQLICLHFENASVFMERSKKSTIRRFASYHC